MNQQINKFLTRMEAAEFLNISVRHLDRLIRNGTLRAIKLGRVVRISKVEIERTMEGCELPV
ncbi:MAG: excisionase family DNA-binding protein [Alphaproteobacteria bacterium]|nr:excisionase family DNA-binding protein [Alphaproteobacteria bacterium]